MFLYVAGKAFVITGVLDCMEREEAADLIKVRAPLPSECVMRHI